MKFETQEQRDAWEVSRKSIMNCNTISYQVAIEMLDKAAAEFDRMKATCGLKPLSLEHALMILHSFFSGSKNWHREIVLRFFNLGIAETDPPQDEHSNCWKLTDKGREVLANLNAMCKVEK